MTETPPFSRLKLAHGDIAQVYNTISQAAIQFAILGYSDVARSLVSKLNEYDYYHGLHVTLRPLYLLWDMTGSWSDHEENRARESIAKDRRRLAESGQEQNEIKRVGKRARTTTQNKPVTADDVQAEIQRLKESWADGWFRPDQARSGIGLSRDLKKTESTPNTSPSELIKAILAAIDQMRPEEHKDSQTGYLAMNVGSGLVNALDLRLQLAEVSNKPEEYEHLPSVDNLLGMIAKRLDANSQTQYLCQSPRIWKILSEGALASVLKVDLEQVNALAEDFEKAVYIRFKYGKMGYPSCSMDTILKMMEENTRHFDDAEELGGQLAEDETLFREPATSTEIVDTEERLGIKLPNDYKEFLMKTNGFGSAFSGILLEPPLHPLFELRWFTDDEDYFTELCLDMPGNVIPAVQSYDIDGNADWVKVGKAIEIGTEDIDNIWLIPPPKMQDVRDRVTEILESDGYDQKVKTSVLHMVENFAGSEETFRILDWGCVTWAAGGSAYMTVYPSFHAYLREVAHAGRKNNSDLLSERKFFGYAMMKEPAAQF